MADDFRRVLSGAPGLRRALKGTPDARLDQYQSALSDIDPKRFRGLYRQRLKELTENDRAAAPVQERQRLETALRDPSVRGADRDALEEQLRRNSAGWGTVAEREDPYRWGSVAQQRFGSLYRR